MPPTVSILIPTLYDSKPQLDLCLRTIRKYTRIPYRLIVGDAGVFDETRAFLEEQDDVTVVPCPNPLRAKDTLARVVETPFFLFQHDDTMVLREGWIERRLALMEADDRLGIIGVVAPCFVSGIRRYLPLSVLDRRFLPLCMLVRTSVQAEFDLIWGLYRPFDTGTIAYLQMRKQRRWRVRRMGFKEDVKHWTRLAWARKKADVESHPDSAQYLAERARKLELIEKILADEAY